MVMLLCFGKSRAAAFVPIHHKKLACSLSNRSTNLSEKETPA
ncbi:hypothetical protein KNP414_03928 [Paenibacillus mucilaginosus KNP414]|uniref:Uncharacterized protein n=1 Tax=Paenibacillus mucilaginosus (strain KNP414) TaxID=1036673 RepID=F8F918_PAEMK|nr:hypothetical protein KNP414_03928 [Paenibacillus mucilaginosus KNP414]